MISRKRLAKALILAGLLLFPFLVYASSFETPSAGVDLDRLLSENALKDGENIRTTPVYKAYGVSVHLMQVRREETPHIHEYHDLLITLKKGKGTLNLGGRKIEMREGDSAFVPRGVPHFFVNAGEGAAAGLGVFMPPYDGKDVVEVEIR